MAAFAMVATVVGTATVLAGLPLQTAWAEQWLLPVLTLAGLLLYTLTSFLLPGPTVGGVRSAPAPKLPRSALPLASGDAVSSPTGALEVTGTTARGAGPCPG